jgi:Bacterial regulatory helix-turn-helix protein, lysR family
MVIAADRRSFRQAVIELGVWESTIGRGIHDLEDEIGVALFIRHPGGVTLHMRQLIGGRATEKSSGTPGGRPGGRGDSTK